MQSYQLTAPERRELEGRIFTSGGIGMGDRANNYILDPDNAKIDVWDELNTMKLFEFGEDLSGFPPDSKYTEFAKWFKPSELELDPVKDEIHVLDDSWAEWVTFNLDGLPIRSQPFYRRR